MFAPTAPVERRPVVDSAGEATAGITLATGGDVVKGAAGAVTGVGTLAGTVEAAGSTITVAMVLPDVSTTICWITETVVVVSVSVGAAACRWRRR